MGDANTRFIPYALLIFKSQKSFPALSLFLLTSLGISWFLGQTAVIETRETSLVLMRETARLFCVFGPSFLISSFLLDFQKRGEFQTWLTNGLSRPQFICNSFMLGILLSLILILLSTFFTGLLVQEFSVVWVCALFLESTILLSIALFFSLNLSSLLKIHTLLMATYFLGRLKGLFLSSLAAPWLDYSAASSTILKIFLAPIPDFSIFNNTLSWGNITLETLLSCALFMIMTHWSFRKKCL